MGSPEPRSFSRGKRGIAGSLVFTVFDRDALISSFKAYNKNDKLQKFIGNDSESGYSPYSSIDEWDRLMTSDDSDGSDLTVTNSTVGSIINPSAEIAYADEILPFDITITFANEYGQKAVVNIYGVELLNEGSGFSVDTVVAEKAYTFIARRVDYMTNKTEDGQDIGSIKFAGLNA